jgi:hypothetical protein
LSTVAALVDQVSDNPAAKLTAQEIAERVQRAQALDRLGECEAIGRGRRRERGKHCTAGKYLPEDLPEVVILWQIVASGCTGLH